MQVRSQLGLLTPEGQHEIKVDLIYFVKTLSRSYCVPFISAPCSKENPCKLVIANKDFDLQSPCSGQTSWY